MAPYLLVARHLVALILLLPVCAWAQADYRIYEQHPRLLLKQRQLSRLRKDVERQSTRWRQLHKLVENNAAFPEEPLVRAVLYQVAADEEAGKQAKGWLLDLAGTSNGFQNAENLRLGAIVFDWCYALFSDAEKFAAAEALVKGAQNILSSASDGARPEGIDSIRGAVLAAVAVGGDWPGSEPALEAFFEQHWKPIILPALLRGELLDQGYEQIAVMEICHVIRHNLERDLWRDATDVFRPLPHTLMLQYYPEPLQTEEGLFHRPAVPSSMELDVPRESSLRRIAEMLLVGYENGWDEYRYLQGWLRHDAYSLNTPLGAVYEFLWVNPYLPGLSFFSAPVFSQDELRGRLFVRAGWQDDDLWAGYINGEFQVFADGQRHIIPRQVKQAPLIFSDTAVVFGSLPLSFKVKVPDGKRIFIVGLGDAQAYRVKINRKPFEIFEAGRGGILLLENAPDGTGTEKKEPLLDFDKRVSIEVKAAPAGPTLLNSRGRSSLRSSER